MLEKQIPSKGGAQSLSPKGQGEGAGLPGFGVSKCPFEHLSRLVHSFGMKMDFLSGRIWQYITGAVQRIFPWPEAQQELCWRNLCIVAIQRHLCRTKTLTH